MYSKAFYIKQNLWNNTFSFAKRESKKLYIPSLKKINSLDEIKLGEKIVFEDYDENWVLQSCKWLKNFYEIDIKNIKLYLFDNHNHAYYFWHKAKFDGIIWNNSVLTHIDEHSDLRDPWVYLEKIDLKNQEKIFKYTNQVLNVWNYIIPAKKDWLIKEVIQIRSENELKKFSPLIKEERGILKNDKSIILNLDLDFFEPKLDYINYNLKKEVILEITKKASLITVATSPFFIGQNLALKVFRDLFW